MAQTDERLLARRWWEGLMNGTKEVGVAGPALFGFVRLVSNPRVLDRPLPEILEQLPLSPLVREALVSGGTSKPAKIVETVRHQNRGDLAMLASAGFSAQARSRTHRSHW